MSKVAFRQRIEELLARAEIEINGSRPWDIQIHNDELFGRLVSGGSLALGQLYTAGWWDSPMLDEFFHRVLSARLDSAVRSATWVFEALRARLLNLQTPSRSYEVGRRHYDLGNDLYQRMLDRNMLYSCGYWEEASTLDEAQEAKLDMVCGKLGLRPGMRLLDIGCGWGGTARFAAERYGAEVVGITISEEQARHARELCRGFPVEIRLQDYRDVRETFDRALSIGMFEHVGYKNYRTYMQAVRSCLKEDGLFLLHTIGGNNSVTRLDPWMERYIFPNSMLPSARQISAAIEDLFVLEDWHSFGPHYDRTLMEWFRNFHESWESLSDRYDESFYRMWKYYLLSSAGAFRARINQLWQIVLSPNGIPGGYRAPRYSGVRDRSAEPDEQRR